MAKEKSFESEFEDKNTMRNLTDNELRSLSMDIRMAGGVDEFLVGKKAIKIREDGEIAVQLYQGLGVAGIEVIEGTGILIETDIPLNTWNKIIPQVEYYWRCKEEAKKHEQNTKTSNISG